MAEGTLQSYQGDVIHPEGQMSICNKYHDIHFSQTTNVSPLVMQRTVN